MHRVSPAAETRARGFTLVELAVVLLILSVLAAVLLVPLSGREEIRRRHETERALVEIREALIGFAIIYKRLPCPTRETNPAAPGYGQEEAPPCTEASEGYLPWRTLGLAPFDAWGSPRTSASDPWTGYWRYRPDPGFTQQADTSCPWPRWPIAPDTRFESVIRIVDASGSERTVSSGSAPTDCLAGEPEQRKLAAAVVYSAGPNRTADGQNASYEATGTSTYQQDDPTTNFDDLLIWIGKPLLIGRMGAAGSL